MEAILEAAAQVFEARGYVDATTDRIAERAGVSVGSVYQYFPSKDALLVALLERHLAEAEALLQPLFASLDADTALDDFVGQLVGVGFALHRASPKLHQVLTEEAPVPAAIRDRLADAERGAVEVVAAYLASQSSVTRDSKAAAALVVASVDALSHRLTIRPLGAADLEDEVVAMLLGYLTS